jgi:hypothetical protein
MSLPPVHAEMIEATKPLPSASSAGNKRLRGQTATEYALVLVGVALVAFAGFNSVMARAASTTGSVGRQVAAANPGQGASGGGVSVEWRNHSWR